MCQKMKLMDFVYILNKICEMVCMVLQLITAICNGGYNWQSGLLPQYQIPGETNTPHS